MALPIENKNTTTIITSQNPDVVLDPHSMIGSDPPREHITSILPEIDKLIESIERDSKKKEFLASPIKTISLFCEILLFNKSGKKFKVCGIIDEMEVSLPARFSVYMEVPSKLASNFSQFFIDSSFGNSRNKLLVEHCLTFESRKHKTVLFMKNKNGKHKNHLKLDFFRIKKQDSDTKLILQLEFYGI